MLCGSAIRLAVVQHTRLKDADKTAVSKTVGRDMERLTRLHACRAAAGAAVAGIHPGVQRCSVHQDERSADGPTGSGGAHEGAHIPDYASPIPP